MSFIMKNNIIDTAQNTNLRKSNNNKLICVNQSGLTPQQVLSIVSRIDLALKNNCESSILYDSDIEISILNDPNYKKLYKPEILEKIKGWAMELALVKKNQNPK